MLRIIDHLFWNYTEEHRLDTERVTEEERVARRDRWRSGGQL